MNADKDGDGEVTVHELAAQLEHEATHTPPAMPEDEAAKIFNSVDQDKDGFITYDEYASAMRWCVENLGWTQE